MARRSDVHPQPPRVSPPDLPARLQLAAGLQAHEDHFQLQITDLEPRTDAAHAALTECTVAAASVDRLDLTGATIVDVAIDELRATTLIGREARLRRVRITGGRIGTLDL